jgi:hypothetical protein
MKISELVKKLEEIRDKHGDLDVKYANKEAVQIGEMTWDTDVQHKNIVGVEVREDWSKGKKKKAGDFVELDEY